MSTIRNESVMSRPENGNYQGQRDTWNSGYTGGRAPANSGGVDTFFGHYSPVGDLDQQNQFINQMYLNDYNLRQSLYLWDLNNEYNDPYNMVLRQRRAGQNPDLTGIPNYVASQTNPNSQSAPYVDTYSKQLANRNSIMQAIGLGTDLLGMLGGPAGIASGIVGTASKLFSMQGQKIQNDKEELGLINDTVELLRNLGGEMAFNSIDPTKGFQKENFITQFDSAIEGLNLPRGTRKRIDNIKDMLANSIIKKMFDLSSDYMDSEDRFHKTQGRVNYDPITGETFKRGEFGYNSSFSNISKFEQESKVLYEKYQRDLRDIEMKIKKGEATKADLIKLDSEYKQDFIKKQKAWFEKISKKGDAIDKYVFYNYLMSGGMDKDIRGQILDQLKFGRDLGKDAYDFVTDPFHVKSDMIKLIEAISPF